MPKIISVARIIRIFHLSLPIILAMLSQSIMGLVDTAIVGHLGTPALAAVGAGNFSMYFCLALIAGLSTAVQTQVSRRFGKYGKSYTHATVITPLYSGFILTVLLVIPLSAILLCFSQDILFIVTPSSGVIAGTKIYLDIRLLSLPAAAISLSFRGFWNGTHHSGIFLRLLLISHTVNAVLSFLLVYGKLGMPALGIKGAAIGTLIAMYTGVVLNILCFKNRYKDFLLKQTLPSRLQIINTLKLAFPDSLQQTLFALGVLVFYGIIATLGEQAMAVGFIINNLTIFLILAGIGFGTAGASLTGYSIGAGKVQDATQWVWATCLAGCSTLFLLSLPLLLTPQILLAVFSGGDISLVQMGKLPLQLAAMSILADGLSLILAQALLSVGMTKQVLMVRASTLWLLGLPLCLLSVYAGYGLIALWSIQIIQRLITSVWLASLWCKGQWKFINL